MGSECSSESEAWRALKRKKAKLRREKVNEKEMRGNRTFGRAGE